MMLDWVENLKQMPVLHVNLFDGKAEIVRKQVFLLLFKLKKNQHFSVISVRAGEIPRAVTNLDSSY